MNQEEKDKILLLLRVVTDTLQSDYESTQDCKKAINNCLGKINEYGKELTGKDIIKLKTVIEYLAFPDNAPKHYRK